MSQILLNSKCVKTKIGFTLVLLVGSGLLVASSLPGLAVASINEMEPSRTTHWQVADRIEAELITIRPTGFDPAEITRPRGRFILAVNNRSGIHELDLRLDRESGARQQEVRLPRGRLGWKKTVDLPPGRYVLTEAKHPDWICRITITAK